MNEKLIIPASIIIAGAIIGAAVYFGGSSPTVNYPQENEGRAQEATVQAKKVDPTSDNIYGSPGAEIFVIEYSDLDCPFCARYHNNALAQLKSNYTEDDRVAFVFRHFPLDEPYTQPLHPQATEKHIAAECVAQVAGNDAFNSFITAIFSGDRDDDLLELSAMAVESGAKKTAFDTCYNNRDTESVVSAGFQDGAQAGVQGTPSVFLQTKDGQTFQIPADFNAIKIGVDGYLGDLK